MSLFAKPTGRGKKGTTLGFFLGKPEAEGDKIKLNGRDEFFFEDFLNITDSVAQGSFIILGRKGVGKSAFAKHIERYAKNSQTAYSALIDNHDIELESALQAIPSSIDNRYELLFEWIILTKLTKLLLDTHNGTASENIPILEKFYKTNSGIMDISKLAVLAQKKDSQIQVNLMPLPSLQATYNNNSEIEFGRLPFYDFIPQLREIIIKTLRYAIFKDYEFFIMFDDLDINFKLKEDKNRLKILNLLRIAKRYNNEYLEDTNSKILIFLRDDIAKGLSGADTAKLFATYAHTINWYSRDDELIDEKEILLRKLINKRIEINFKNFDYPYDTQDPWITLVDNTPSRMYGNKTAFKFLLDFTFYRPRDLLYIFKDIGKHSYPYPLDNKAIFTIIKQTCVNNLDEILNELDIYFDQYEIRSIRELLREIAFSKHFLTYKEIQERLRAHSLNKDVFKTLIDYNLIVPFDTECQKIYFAYREDSPEHKLESYRFVLPKGILICFNPDKALGTTHPQEDDIDF